MTFNPLMEAVSSPLPVPSVQENVEVSKTDQDMKAIFQDALVLAYTEGNLNGIENSINAFKTINTIAKVGTCLTAGLMLANNSLLFWNWHQSSDGKYLPLFGTLGGPEIIPDLPREYFKTVLFLSSFLTTNVISGFCTHAIQTVDKLKIELLNARIQSK